MPPTRRSLTRTSSASTLSGDSVTAAYVDTPFGADEGMAPAENMPPTLPIRPGRSGPTHRDPVAPTAIEMRRPDVPAYGGTSQARPTPYPCPPQWTEKHERPRRPPWPTNG